MTLSMPRMIYAFARDGYLPRVFAQVQANSQAPTAAIIFHAILTFALATTGTFEKLAIFANVSALGLYLGCALASWQLRRNDASTSGPRAAVVPLLACGVIAWILTGLTGGEWLAFGACLVGATVLYLLARKK
jgi:basic amino acid/polyamine antiporter, APA family